MNPETVRPASARWSARAARKMESPSGTSNPADHRDTPAPAFAFGTRVPHANWEARTSLGTVLLADGIVAVDVRLSAVRIRRTGLSAAHGLVVSTVVFRGDAFTLEFLIAIVR